MAEQDAELIEAPVTAEVADQPQSAPAERDFDGEAREMGWVPKENYKGDAATWKDAETFVKRGESFLPIVKAQLKVSEEKRAKEAADFKQKIERLERVSEKVLKSQKAQYDAELASFKEQQIAAVEAGDVAAYKAIDRKIAGLEAPSPVEPMAGPDAVFKEKNPWYQVDPVMTAAAVAISEGIVQSNPNMPMADMLAQTEARMHEEFPHKFKSPNGKAAAVDPGSDFPGLRQAAKKESFATLPADAKAAFAMFVKNGAFKDTAADQAKYAGDYYG